MEARRRSISGTGRLKRILARTAMTRPMMISGVCFSRSWDIGRPPADLVGGLVPGIGPATMIAAVLAVVRKIILQVESVGPAHKQDGRLKTVGPPGSSTL